MPRGVHASVVRKPEARLYSGSTCLAGSCDLPTRQSGVSFLMRLAIVVARRARAHRAHARARRRAARLRHDRHRRRCGRDRAGARRARRRHHRQPRRGRALPARLDVAARDRSQGARRQPERSRGDGRDAARRPCCSLALPPDFRSQDFDALDRRLRRAGRARGRAARRRQPRRGRRARSSSTSRRSAPCGRGACCDAAAGAPGDELYVTGALGAAAAGLAMLTARRRSRRRSTPTRASASSATSGPTPRLRCGLDRRPERARPRPASTCRMAWPTPRARWRRPAARASSSTPASLPVHAGARVVGRARPASTPSRSALAGGEDYELLFAVSPPRAEAFLAAARRLPRPRR